MVNVPALLNPGIQRGYELSAFLGFATLKRLRSNIHRQPDDFASIQHQCCDRYDSTVWRSARSGARTMARQRIEHAWLAVDDAGRTHRASGAGARLHRL